MKYLQLILRLPYDLVRYFVTYFPGPWGRWLRYWFWKPQLGKLGRKTIIGVGVHFEGASHIYLYDRVWIDRFVTILAGPDTHPRKVTSKINLRYQKNQGEVHIHPYCHIAPYVLINGKAGVEIRERTGVSAGSKIYSLSHHYRNLSDIEDRKYYPFSPLTPMDEQALISGPIVLGPDAAVGLDCRILPGVSLGERSWLGMGQSMTKDIPPGHIYDDKGLRLMPNQDQ